MKTLISLIIMMFAFTLYAEDIYVLPLLINQEDTKSEGLKGTVKSMVVLKHLMDTTTDYKPLVLETSYSFNRQGNVIDQKDIVSHEVYNYDKEGIKRLSKETYSVRDGDLISREIFKYNNMENLDCVIFSSGEKQETLKYKYSYHKDGRIDYIVVSPSDESFWVKTELIYNKSKITGLISFAEMKPLLFQTFDGDIEHPIECILYGSDKNVILRILRKYNLNKQIIAEQKFCEGDSLKEAWGYVYDESGTLTKMISLEGTESVFSGYDSYGNWTKKENITDGQIVSTEIRKIEYYE